MDFSFPWQQILQVLEAAIFPSMSINSKEIHVALLSFI
jgi:hypothetical protein